MPGTTWKLCGTNPQRGQHPGIAREADAGGAPHVVEAEQVLRVDGGPSEGLSVGCALVKPQHRDGPGDGGRVEPGVVRQSVPDDHVEVQPQGQIEEDLGLQHEERPCPGN